MSLFFYSLVAVNAVLMLCYLVALIDAFIASVFTDAMFFVFICICGFKMACCSLIGCFI